MAQNIGAWRVLPAYIYKEEEKKMKLKNKYYVGSGTIMDSPVTFSTIEGATKRAAELVKSDGISRPIVEIKRIVRKADLPVLVVRVD